MTAAEKIEQQIKQKEAEIHARHVIIADLNRELLELEEERDDLVKQMQDCEPLP